MGKLRLKTRCKSNTTIIENEFIDTYMARANGEYVKVYLYLVRHLNAPDNSISLSMIADSLDHTEKDVLRALKYWEKQGLLMLENDENGKISGIDIATISANNVDVLPLTKIPSAQPIVAIKKPTVITKPAEDSAHSRKEFQQLLFVAEQYLGKTLTKTDVDRIRYFSDDLQFPFDLIEYLIEYCAENNHKSFHYIHAVALSWFDAGILTVIDAKHQILTYNKDYYQVLKAYGITGRGPAASEKQYIDKWTKDMGFDLELICEACNRTMSKIHQPSFEYTNSILESWKIKNICFLKDLDALDAEFKSANTAQKPSKTKKTASTSFNNFESKDYDMASLEKKLLSN